MTQCVYWYLKIEFTVLIKITCFTTKGTKTTKKQLKLYSMVVFVSFVYFVVQNSSWFQFLLVRVSG